MSKVVKVVKKVAPYVAAAAAVYYGGPMIASSLSTAAPVGTTAFWQGANTAFGGLGTFGSALSSGLSFSNVASAGSLLMQAGSLSAQTAGNIQSQKYASQQTDFQRKAVAEQNKSDEARNRYNQLQYKRNRINAIRQGRIQQGRIVGSMGSVLGSGGTSSLIGSVGSIGTQTAANVGNINVAEGYGNAISQFNRNASDFTSQANTAGSKGSAWDDVAVLGGNIFKNSDKIGNFAGNAIDFTSSLFT
tara:strand:+ start:367 stop:1104 length:738 start_codon:yes stop_codon:yes gene_type:complete